MEGSIIPGESEEDGRLRREYVLVGDPRAVQFDLAVDGTLNTSSLLTETDQIDAEIAATRRRPIHERDRSYGSNREATFTQDNPTGMAASPPKAIVFPPPPNPNTPPMPSPPRGGANALTRALTSATKHLFGVTTPYVPSRYRDSGAPSSPRRQQIILGKGTDDANERDPLEGELLADLEELAQKTAVLTSWSDEMYDQVKAVPHSKSKVLCMAL